MASKKKTVKRKKVKLKDLLGGGKANADLYKGDPERRKHHVRHRAPRDRLITPKGSDYVPLAVNVERDMKLNELAREFINNGMDKTKAVCAVFGVSRQKAATTHYSQIFDSVGFRKKLADMMYGSDGKLVEPAKEFGIQIYMRWLNTNLLDFFDDDGNFLSVKEMRQLPPEIQTQISALNMVTISRKVALTDNDGNVIMDENGDPRMVDHVEQRVNNVGLPDKQKTLEHFTKLMGWVITQHEHNHHLFAADMLEAAEARLREMRREDIEGTAKRIPAD